MDVNRATTPQHPPTCEHRWVFKHQPDFPPEIFWISVCTLCHAIDGKELTAAIQLIKLRDEEGRPLVPEVNDLKRHPRYECRCLYCTETVATDGAYCQRCQLEGCPDRAGH